MLLHHYLQRKADIHKRAKAEYDNLLTEINDPNTKAIVEDWEPGDTINDEYPQGKKEDVEKAEMPDLPVGAGEAQTTAVASGTAAEGAANTAATSAWPDGAQSQQDSANAPA